MKFFTRLIYTIFIIFPLSIFFTVLILIGIITAVLTYDYILWERNYESNYLQSEYIQISQPEGELKEKIENVSTSKENVYTLELTPSEFTTLIGNSISSALLDGVTIRYANVETKDGEYAMYFNLNVKDIITPWVKVIMKKDVAESINIYVYDIAVGNISLKEWGATQSLARINYAISESLFLANQSDSEGRRLTNIELEKEGVFLKITR